MDLTKGNLKSHLIKMAIPASIGFFFNILFNVTDTYYAGLLGTQAQAGLAFSFVLFFIVIASCVGASQAASGIVSRNLGNRRIRRARQYIAQFVVITIIIGVLLLLFGRTLLEQSLVLLGAKDAAKDFALEYLQVIFDYSIFFASTLILSGLLASQGDTVTFRNALIIASLLNIGLNPLLMFGWGLIPALGMAGIGIATILINVFMTIWLLIRYIKIAPLSGMKRIYFLPKSSALIQIIKQGIPATVNMFSISIGFFINTYFLAQLDSSVIAAYGIALRIEQIFLACAIGLNTAVIAIAGQNFGAKNYTRVREIRNMSLKVSLGFAAISIIFLLGLGKTLLASFNSDAQIISYGYKYLIAASMLAPLYSLFHNSVAILQAIGKPAVIAPIALLRLFLLPVIFNLIFTFWLDLKDVGVWIALVLANYLAGLMLVWFANNNLSRICPV